MCIITKSALPSFSPFPLAFTALCIMDRNDSSAFRAGIFLCLLCQKFSHSLFFYCLAIFHQAGMVADIITFFKPLYLFTWIFKTLKAICNLPLCRTILYPAFPTMLRFSPVTYQTACTRLFMITMLIANQTVHPTGGKHDRLYLFWHLHFRSSPIFVLLSDKVTFPSLQKKITLCLLCRIQYQ